MKKRMLSLLCVLALCLGLLPVTALAEGTAPQSLYVGSTTISAGYWTSSDGGTTWARQENQPEGNNYIYYDGQGTLKLHNVTIQGGSNTVSPPYGAGIYALCSSNQPVALTIELIGTNTITGYYGIFLNAEASATSYGTDASLTITSENNGSLQVSSLYYGIYVKSGTGNASLTINDASVVASSSSSYGYAGVCVQSGAIATGTPNISLAVDGGSLTASGTGSSDGIQFYVGSSQATGATTSLTVSENAIVDARNGGISALKITETLPTPTPTGDNSSGIVFDGSTGTVYGDVTLDEPLTVGAGETLTIPEGAELNCNGKLTNNGTILVESGGTVSGSLSGGSTVTTPSITAQPTDNTVTEGSAAEFSITATAGSENPTYQWQQSTDNGSNWTNIESATSASYTTDATTTSMSGYQYRCVVKSASGVGVISSAAILTVQTRPAPVPVTGVTLNENTLELYTGKSETLIATVQPDNATNKAVTWSSDKPEVATVEGGTVTAVKEGEATITATATDGSNISATCTVKVTQATYNISVEGSLDFGEAYTGYAQPTAKTVTITNTGNQTLTLDPPASTNSFEVGNLSKTQLAPDEKATFTVQPKADLAVGSYKESINISGSNGSHKVSTSVDATFAVVDINDTSVNNKLTVTSGISDNITYYTCPSCGYHNWTATDAGYRCDNCGYLESTRQLSGYGNVKGTYTPGSGATSTAASAVPQTGDESNPVLWTVLLLVSGLALGGLALRRKTEHSRS